MNEILTEHFLNIIQKRNKKKKRESFFIQVSKNYFFFLQAIATHKSQAGSFGTLPGQKYWTGSGAI